MTVEEIEYAIIKKVLVFTELTESKLNSPSNSTTLLHLLEQIQI